MKLTKAQIDRLEAIATELEESAIAGREAVEQYQEECRKAWGPLGMAIERYRLARDAAIEFSEDIASELEGYAEDRSEAWHETEAASQHADWVEEWGGVEIPEWDPEVPDTEIELPEESGFRDMPIERG